MPSPNTQGPTMHTGRLRWTIMLAFASLAPLACAESPAAPAPTALVTDATADAAAVSQGTGVFEWDGYAYIDCIGEEAHSVVSAPYEYHLVERANGESVYVELWDQHAITGTLDGLTSGHHWTRIHNVSPMVIRSAGGGMTHYTFRGTFVSETGPTLEWTEVFHTSRDANGRLVAEKLRINCRVM